MLKKVFVYAFLMVAAVAALGLAYFYFRYPVTTPPSTVRVAATEVRLQRGKFIFEVIGACGDCHTERDFSRFAGPKLPGREGVGTVFPAEMGFPGTVVAPNITPDPETGIGGWSDGEKIRAIRDGVSRDGQVLFPLMPYEQFRQMSDEDVYSLVAYLNSLKPVKNALVRSKINFPVSVLIKTVPRPAGEVAGKNPSSPLEYGEYLATIGGCRNCHTPSNKGEPVPGKDLAGGQIFRTAVGVVVSANITPDPDTGIGKWREQDFLNKFYQYRRYVEQGSPQVGWEGFTLMPWLSFCQLSENDLRAIFAYLKSQKAVYNSVETHPASLQPVKLLSSGQTPFPFISVSGDDLSNTAPEKSVD